MMGNFERTFPWAVAENFDILIPGQSEVGGPHDHLLLFMPGHLAFFRNSAQFTVQFLEFPNFRNLDAFLNLPWVDTAAGEHLIPSIYAENLLTDRSMQRKSIIRILCLRTLTSPFSCSLLSFTPITPW
jgi:hypothetical protein